VAHVVAATGIYRWAQAEPVAQVELSGKGPVAITCSIRKFAALPDEKIRKKVVRDLTDLKTILRLCRH
jgi:hypothetical protein